MSSTILNRLVFIMRRGLRSSSISTLGEAGAEEGNSELDDTVSLPAEETKFVTAKSEQSLLNDMGLPRLVRCNAARIVYDGSKKKTEE